MESSVTKNSMIKKANCWDYKGEVMFIIGIIGIIMLFWFALVGLWKLIPWLVLAVIVTSIISIFLEHMVWVFVIVGVLAVFYFIGTHVDQK